MRGLRLPQGRGGGICAQCARAFLRPGSLGGNMVRLPGEQGEGAHQQNLAPA